MFFLELVARTFWLEVTYIKWRNLRYEIFVARPHEAALVRITLDPLQVTFVNRKCVRTCLYEDCPFEAAMGTAALF